MSWTKQAKKDALGRWIKFDEEHPSWVMTFLGDPKRVEKTSTMGDRKGEIYYAYEFPVEVDGEEKILSATQRSLINQLAEEHDEEPLPGRTLMIKCLDLRTKREWKIREVKAEGSLETWKGKKEPKKEEEAQEKEETPNTDEKKKDKEKFKKEVAKRTTARKKAEKKEPEVTNDATENGQAEETREIETE